jgi:hypothetical protein
MPLRADAAVVLQRARERLRLLRLRDDAEPVAQPLHRRAGDEDRALERVRRRAGGVAADRGEQAAPAAHPLRAGVEQQERAGAVGALGGARREAALAEQRRLLVTRDARDRDLVPEPLGVREAEDA